MSGQVLVDTAKVSHLLQISVHLLIRKNRQQYSFLFAIRIILVPVKDLLCGRKEGDMSPLLRFVTLFLYPKVSIKPGLKVF